MSWIEDADGGSVLNLRVIPNAARNEIVGPHADRLKIKIQNPPEDGKANRALIKLLSKSLDVSKSSIVILRGGKSREKRILVAGTEAGQVRERLDIPPFSA